MQDNRKSELINLQNALDVVGLLWRDLICSRLKISHRNIIDRLSRCVDAECEVADESVKKTSIGLDYVVFLITTIFCSVHCGVFQRN